MADEDLIAHSPPGNAVFMSLARIRRGFVPWTHEAAHIVLAPKSGDWVPDDAAAEKMPLWLIEGLAEVMAIEVAADTRPRGAPRSFEDGRGGAFEFRNSGLARTEQLRDFYLRVVSVLSGVGYLGSMVDRPNKPVNIFSVSMRASSGNAAAKSG